MKGAQAAVFGMKCIDVRNEAIKILVIYFSYNQKIKDEKILVIFQIFKMS